VLATALVNESEPPSALRARPHGACLRYAPAIEALDLARRGDAAALCKLLRRAPDVLASAPHAADLLRLAVLAGRGPVVDLLIGNGVDVNKPSPIKPLIFVTPLCAARMKRRKEIEAVLLRHGAEEDIFTHALLGGLAGLREDLAHLPSAAQANDPAVDALAITPVHHAVAGRRVEVLHDLLAAASRVNESLRGGTRALGMAVAQRVCRSASSSRCAGRRQAHDRAEDRRRANDGAPLCRQGGFVKTIAVLLDHGADPAARDDNGLTPLDWLARATNSVDRDAVRRLLHRPRAFSTRHDP
jgi:hypothetical protein